MTDWFRSWHGAPSDPKWRTIAKRAKVSTSLVVAVAWTLLDRASQCDDRGSIAGVDVETIADFLDTEASSVEAVISALCEKGVLHNGRFVAWEKRQPKREDLSSTDRVRQFRERQKSGSVAELQRTETPMKRDETHGNGLKRDETTEESREDKKQIITGYNCSSTTPREQAAAASKSESSKIDTNQFDVLEQKLRSAAGFEDAPYPNLMMVGPIMTLIREGYDLETEILPVIRARAKAANKPIQSWAFFVPAIVEAKQAAGKVVSFSGKPVPIIPETPDEANKRYRAAAKADGCDPDTELGLRKLIIAALAGKWRATWGADPGNEMLTQADASRFSLLPQKWVQCHFSDICNVTALWAFGGIGKINLVARNFRAAVYERQQLDDACNAGKYLSREKYLKIDPSEAPRGMSSETTTKSTTLAR